MEVRRVRLNDPEVAPLLEGLAVEYAARYGSEVSSEEMRQAGADDFDPPAGAFVLLMDSGVAVAGGGIRSWSGDTCEVKRLWTDAHRRRQGLARRVMGELEAQARLLGYRRVRIVTGPAQPEAVALYESLGYVSVPFDGDWGGLAFERDLADDPPRRTPAPAS